MKGHRPRKRAFQPIGAVRPGQLGLSRTRTRELGLAHAWRTVAGEAIAECTRVAVRRGVLDVVVCDATWLTAIEPLMPEMVGRLRREFGELRIDAWRVGLAGAPGPVRRPPDADQNA